MFRRDFLKFLGLAGAVAGTGVGVLHGVESSVSQPVSVSVAPTVVEIATTVAPEKVNEVVTFDFGGNGVTIIVDEGKLDYWEEQEFDFLKNRGQLEGTIYNGSTFHFTLDIRAKCISDDTFLTRIRSGEEFSILYNGMRLDNCLWECMQYDLSSGDFSIEGRVQPKVTA